MHMVLLTLIAAKGWSGFLIMVGVVPLPVILLLVGRWRVGCRLRGTCELLAQLLAAHMY